MNISLIAIDGHNFPNFALMKLAAWHKAHGDAVDWYNPLISTPDRIYASKIFTFTPDYPYFPSGIEIVKGGTGYDVHSKLPDEIDSMLPDYSIYPQFKYAIGFLSRGCIRNCPWCVVPKKEGNIRQYDDIERISQGRKHVVLMDNNFLANDFEFVKEQLEKSARLGLQIDFNQGLDARLVTPENAALLANCHWRDMNGNNHYIRFSCDTQQSIQPVKNAISTLRHAGYLGHIFIYFLAKDVDETLDRITTITSHDTKIDPFVMPYRNLNENGQIPNPSLKHLARWCNITSIRKSVPFHQYKYNK